MHLMLMTRGILRQVEEFKSLLQAQRFPWKRINLETGKEELSVVQGALRPIQFWEYVFPEDALNDVLGALNIKHNEKSGEMKNKAWLLRKLFKLAPIPEQKEISVVGYRPSGTLNGEPMPSIPVHNMFVDGVGVYPIGIKKDTTRDFDWGTEGKYNQEGL